MLPKFDDGCGISWAVGGVSYHGVVMSSSSDVFEIIPVRSLTDDIRCYDEGGAKYSRDKDNVRLRDCPPPFTALCERPGSRGCYAQAGENSRLYLAYDDLARGGAELIDRGRRISGRDKSEILDHPWRDEKEKGLPAVTRSPKMAELFRKAASMHGPDQKAGPDGPEF